MERKTSHFRQLIKKGTVVMPGAFNSATALVIEKVGFDAVYISGAGLSNGKFLVPLFYKKEWYYLSHILYILQMPEFIENFICLSCGKKTCCHSPELRLHFFICHWVFWMSFGMGNHL